MSSEAPVETLGQAQQQPPATAANPAVVHVQGQPTYGAPPPQGQPMYAAPPQQGQPMYGAPPQQGQPMYNQQGQPVFYQQQPMYVQGNPGQQQAIFAQSSVTNTAPPGYPVAMPMGEMKQQGVPVPPSNCGLGYLSLVDSLFVKQKTELMEAVTGFETQNKYKVQNKAGQVIFKAKEKSGCCARQLCAQQRGFTMKIENGNGDLVMKIKRPLKCFCPCCCLIVCYGCLQHVTVEDGQGKVIGTIKEKFTLCKPHYLILDADGKVVLEMRGPLCKCSCCGGDVKFRILQPGGEQEVGMIAKKFSGVFKEMFTDADNFGVNFPKEMPVEHKALLLALTFIVDFMWFESNKSRSHHNR